MRLQKQYILAAQYLGGFFVEILNLATYFTETKTPVVPVSIPNE
jgi:hypothetical protein